MKLPFAIGNRPIQGNFDALVSAIVGKRTRGVASVATTAAVSGTATVTHGLGATPSVVLVASNDSPTVVNAGVSAIGPTQFTVGIWYVDGVARTTTIQVGWDAIG